MTGAAKRKGDSAEREAAALIHQLTGWPARRALGAGRTDDTGDIVGVPDTTVQVKNFRDITRAIRDALEQLPVQQANAGTTHAVAFIRRPGGRWFAVMDLPTWATWAREALNNQDTK